MKKIRNLREIRPRNSCANCKHNVCEGGARVCELDTTEVPWGDPYYIYHFYCDSYVHENKLGLELS